MNRITATFHQLASQQRKALFGYITAGDPNFDTSLAILRSAIHAGLDILELGVPFSDPTADGPVIQEASQRALRSGMTLSRTLELAAALRRNSDIPIILFGYYNPFFKYGLARLAHAAKAAGVDGLLIVDLPPEESAPLRAALQDTGIHIILLAAPTTGSKRLREIADKTQGFLYLITKAGTTGQGGLDYDGIRRHAAEVKAVCPVPVCLGFGIRDGLDAQRLGPMADGIVVGSALVHIVGSDPGTSNLPDRVADKVRELRSGLDNR